MNKTYRLSDYRKITAMCGLAGALLMAPFAVAGTAASVAVEAQFAIDAGEAPGWMAAELPDDIRRNVENKGRALAESLALGDAARTERVGKLLAEHYGRVWAWRAEVDADLEAAWSEWNAARSGEKDELRALTVMTEKIDPILAQFQPQISGLLRALKREIGEDKTVELLDRITRSPGAERTYNAYLAMIPEMTDEEKAIIWKRVEQAREDSLSAWSGGQIVRIFKKYKIRNEFSIDYFGYGYRERYKAWASGGR